MLLLASSVEHYSKVAAGRKKQKKKQKKKTTKTTTKNQKKKTKKKKQKKTQIIQMSGLSTTMYSSHLVFVFYTIYIHRHKHLYPSTLITWYSHIPTLQHAGEHYK